MMSLASGSSSIIAGLIISQESENAPLQHYPWVGVVAVLATIAALFILRILRDAEPKSAG
jgi:Flp pilus assembly secretin CpaC